ncbi:hypothetical protein ACBJ59_61355 [Nonomuraea sp. MTCD27]|uniref:hypothetical protein n=1 Tax=Nonomuraea sp. MTCD27 TaxID=1676747 RepID=UPI0035BF92BA
MPGIQAYTPADLARLRTVQTSPGRAVPHVREERRGLRVVRVVRRLTDSGAVVAVRDRTDRRGEEHRDVHVHAPLVIGRLA